MQSICVFCGSSVGNDTAFRQAAEALGQALVQRNITLVYGGENIGLMGVIADQVMRGGGQVIGVIPRKLVEKELAHHGITDLRVVGSMHERKALMAELAEGFIALPGGYGTIEEFSEVLTWGQPGLHSKPTGMCSCRAWPTGGQRRRPSGFSLTRRRSRFLVNNGAKRWRFASRNHRASQPPEIDQTPNSNPPDVTGTRYRTTTA